jgi:aspartate aminotransferase-like enzyme
VADAVHEVGGLFVLDCIASGAVWVDMQATGVDVLISAPQKGWSGSPCCAFVMLSERRAADRRHHQHQLRLRPEEVAADHGDLRERRHAYHATMPTDALATARRDAGDARLRLRKLRAEQIELGRKVRALLVRRGLPSVAAEGFQAPAWWSATPTTTASQRQGLPRRGPADASGVPLQCDEPADFKTFRIGLFGLEKLQHVERTVANLEAALDRIAARGQRAAA